MKRNVILIQAIFLIAFSFLAFGEDGFVLSSDQLSVGSKIAFSKEGNALLFANFIVDQNDTFPVIITLNQNGNVVSAKKVVDGIYYATGIKKLTNGDFLLFGYSKLEENVWGWGLIIISENGEVLFKKGYSSPSKNHFLEDVLETSDKGFLLCSWDLIGKEVVLIKIDSLGNVMWEKAYENVEFGAISEVTNEGYFLASIEWDFTTTLLKLNYNGEILWKKNLKSSIQLWVDGMTDFEGNLVLSCRIQDKNVAHACGIVVLDGDGKVVLKKGFTNGLKYSGIPSIEKIEDGFIILDELQIDNSNWDIWLLKVDRDFNKIWERRFGYDLWDSIDNICETANGDFFASGIYNHHYPSRDFNSLFMKLNSEGTLGFECDFENSVSSSTTDFQVTITEETFSTAGDVEYLSSDINFLYGEDVEIDFFSLCPTSCPQIEIEPSFLIDGKAGEYYSETFSASGGTAPYTFVLSSGNLPDGLTLSESGLLYGVPVKGGEFSFTLSAADSSNCVGRRDYTLHIEALPPSVDSVKKLLDPFRLKILGSNFHSDLKIYIGGDTEPWPKVKYKSSSRIVLKGGKALKEKFPKNVPVEIKIINGDGGETTYTFTR